MKTGAIVYLVGSQDIDRDFDTEEALSHLNINADRVELVLPGVAHYDVMDAWWLLTVKGMKRIVCMLAELADNSQITLTGHELTLCG